MQTIYIDISNKGVIPTIYTKQGDIGRKFLVVFTDAGQAYQIPEGSLFSVWYDGDSGEGNYTDIGESSAFFVDGNKVTVEIISQMVGTPGSGVICLVMAKATGGQIGSWNIPYICEEVPGMDSEVATEYYTAFSRALEDLREITEDLTPGSIGAAPAGYGLGESNAAAYSWNGQSGSGFFRSANYSPDGAWWYGLNCKYYSNSATQIAFKVGDSNDSNMLMAIRHRPTTGSSAVFGEWEYVNPPMEADTEYRTTERYLGKPVYVKLVDFLNLPNGGFKSVSHGTTVSKAIRYKIIAKNSSYMLTWHKDIAYIAVDSSSIALSTTGDLSAYNVYVAIWYTKD